MESLIKFKLFINEILSSNSRNYKLNILEKYKNDLDIKYYLNYVYNPYIITGISKKKINKFSYEDVCLLHMRHFVKYVDMKMFVYMNILI